jgi:3-oxoacyl-[acyl-carrier protein] reductase
MDLGLAGKVVFVAGSSRGIGKGIARVFLDEGARVVLTGRDPQALRAARDALSTGREDRVATYCGDLASAEAIQDAHRQTMGRWGGVDVLVCNVGSGTGRAGWHLMAADWESIFEINLWSGIRLVEVFLPGMVEARRGGILFIGSIAGLESLGAPLPYSAAKAALEKYSKDLARQVAGYGIRVNTIAPGNVIFPGGSWQRKLDGDPAGVTSTIAREVPLARFGEPEEIGAAAAFLASDRASFITGACLVADGGQTRA